MGPASESLISDLEEMLIAEFKRIPVDYVHLQLIQGARDLRGQIVPESLGEMLYILVRHRIASSLDEGAAERTTGALV